jgi:hypothetical protein
MHWTLLDYLHRSPVNWINILAGGYCRMQRDEEVNISAFCPWFRKNTWFSFSKSQEQVNDEITCAFACFAGVVTYQRLRKNHCVEQSLVTAV